MSAIDALDDQLAELRRLIGGVRGLCYTGRPAMPRIDIAALFAWAPLVQRKTARYRLRDGTPVTVVYDPAAPCRACGLPVLWATRAGTGVCPWCEAGTARPDR